MLASIHSVGAYNENSDLIQQVEAYRNAHGYYPEAAIVNTIYGTYANRAWLKEHHICFESACQKRKHKKEMASHNEIEGKFGRQERL